MEKDKHETKKQTKALLIEDNLSITESIELILDSEDICCTRAELDIKGLKIAKIDRYDIIILNMMSPDIDGYGILLRLRSYNIKVPILILSGLFTTDLKIKGLNLGTSDCLTKPFNPGELLARIQAIVRRSKGYSESVIKFDKISLNLDTRNVEIAGTKVYLTNKEYAILELLAIHKGTVLTKEKLFSHLYSNVNEPQDKIVAAFICLLRKKLADVSGGTNYIKNVRGRGYMLKNLE